MPREQAGRIQYELQQDSGDACVLVHAYLPEGLASRDVDLSYDTDNGAKGQVSIHFDAATDSTQLGRINLQGYSLPDDVQAKFSKSKQRFTFRLLKLGGEGSAGEPAPDTQPAQHDQAPANGKQARATGPAAPAKVDAAEPAKDATPAAKDTTTAPGARAAAGPVSDAAAPAKATDAAVPASTKAISTGNAFDFLDAAGEDSPGANSADAGMDDADTNLEEGQAPSKAKKRRGQKKKKKKRGGAAGAAPAAGQAEDDGDDDQFVDVCSTDDEAPTSPRQQQQQQQEPAQQPEASDPAAPKDTLQGQDSTAALAAAAAADAQRNPEPRSDAQSPQGSPKASLMSRFQEAPLAQVVLGAAVPQSPVHGPFIKYNLGKSEVKGEDKWLQQPANSWVLLDEQGTAGFAAFGIFDGHGGKHAATHASKHLLGHVAHYLERCKGATTHAQQKKEGAEEAATHLAASDEDKKVWAAQDALIERVAKAMHAGFLATDEECKGRFKTSGTTATLAIVCGWELLVANVGDSCAYLDTGAQIVSVSGNHRVSDNMEERARIVEAGGEIAPATVEGVAAGPDRVWPGGLAMSRTIGDYAAGDVVTAVPEVRQVTIPSTGARLVIASDGLWDHMQAKSLLHQLRLSPATVASNTAASKAIKKKGLRDDITLIVIDFVPHELDRLPPLLSTGGAHIEHVQVHKPLEVRYDTWREHLATRRATAVAAEAELARLAEAEAARAAAKAEAEQRAAAEEARAGEGAVSDLYREMLECSIVSEEGIRAAEALVQQQERERQERLQQEQQQQQRQQQQEMDKQQQEKLERQRSDKQQLRPNGQQQTASECGDAADGDAALAKDSAAQDAAGEWTTVGGGSARPQRHNARARRSQQRHEQHQERQGGGGGRGGHRREARRAASNGAQGDVAVGQEGLPADAPPQGAQPKDAQQQQQQQPPEGQQGQGQQRQQRRERYGNRRQGPGDDRPPRGAGRLSGRDRRRSEQPDQAAAEDMSSGAAAPASAAAAAASAALQSSDAPAAAVAGPNSAEAGAAAAAPSGPSANGPSANGTSAGDTAAAGAMRPSRREGYSRQARPQKQWQPRQPSARPTQQQQDMRPQQQQQQQQTQQVHFEQPRAAVPDAPARNASGRAPQKPHSSRETRPTAPYADASGNGPAYSDQGPPPQGSVKLDARASAAFVSNPQPDAAATQQQQQRRPHASRPTHPRGGRSGPREPNQHYPNGGTTSSEPAGGATADVARQGYAPQGRRIGGDSEVEVQKGAPHSNGAPTGDSGVRPASEQHRRGGGRGAGRGMQQRESQVMRNGQQATAVTPAAVQA